MSFVDGVVLEVVGVDDGSEVLFLTLVSRAFELKFWFMFFRQPRAM